MTKIKKAQIKLINRLSIGPILLLPSFYWCLVKVQKFENWYIIPLVAIPIGLLINRLVLSIIKKKNPDLLKIKNEKNFKLSHFSILITLFLTLLIITALNVYITIDSKSVLYKINEVGERGTGRNKTSYVEIVRKNGNLEKIDLARHFVESLSGKRTVRLIKYTSIFGLVYHDRY